MAMPPALSEDLVRHVVSFVSDRQVRLFMGYDVGTCIKWRIPPPPLDDNPEFEGRLDRLRRAWLSGNGVRTITEDDVMNHATFMHWGDYDHEHAGFMMHSVCYRSDFNPKVWRVDRVLRYYRYDAEEAPACLTTQCQMRVKAQQ
jgi:hypothetical protein